MKLFDNLSIEIPCPHCGKKTKKPLRSVKNNQRFTCAFCHKTATFETNGGSKRGATVAAKAPGIDAAAAKLKE